MGSFNVLCGEMRDVRFLLLERKENEKLGSRGLKKYRGFYSFYFNARYELVKVDCFDVQGLIT